MKWDKVSEIIKGEREKELMRTEKQKDLAKLIEAQMHIEGSHILTQWLNHTYPINQDTALKFWDTVREAPEVYIVGDYDCDGVCASYIMSKAIRHMYKSKPIRVRIPHRLSEGYGMNRNILNEIKEKMPKGSVIITVDNGIACADLLEEIRAEGYKVLLTDHHELGKNRLPNVDMILNPKVPIDGFNAFDGDYWCGAAVAYKLAENFVSEALKNDLEVMAGIATIGDVMPLKEGNWGLVKRCMTNIKKGNAPASILNLLSKLKQNPENLQETSISFYVVPALNAPGRLYDNGAGRSLGYLLNPTEDKCNELVDINLKRRALRDEQFELVNQYIIDNHMTEDCPIWVAVDGLHEGVVGIIAGRIAEEYKVPAIILTQSEKDPNIYKGSARSAGDIDIFKYLCFIGDLFVGFGGHKGAAGLSMKKENIDLAREKQIFKPKIAAAEGINMVIRPNEIGDIAEICDIYRPFGEGNTSPEFSVDINLNNVKNYVKMLGKPPVHLCINDPLKHYKLIHFNHEPNTLKNNNEFKLKGEIHYETFRNNTTPVLIANDLEDYEVDTNEKSR